MTIKLVVPFDGSPAALRAVEMLAAYAGERSLLEACVLHAQMLPVSFWPRPASAAAGIEEAMLEAGRSLLKPAVSRLASAGIAAHAEVRWKPCCRRTTT